jgi:hypothetical protein
MLIGHTIAIIWFLARKITAEGRTSGIILRVPPRTLRLYVFSQPQDYIDFHKISVLISCNLVVFSLQLNTHLRLNSRLVHVLFRVKQCRIANDTVCRYIGKIYDRERTYPHGGPQWVMHRK